MLNITRHEVVRDDTNKIAKLIIGVTYTDPTTGRHVYRDIAFSVSDFSPTPTKAEVTARIKD